MERIVIIGNGASGKTTLALRMSKHLNLPVHHVDSIQFEQGGERRSAAACDQLIDEIVSGERWIIEGLGRRSSIERRCKAADTVILLDFPLSVHYWCAAKRVWKSRDLKSSDLPHEFDEFSIGYAWGLARSIWRVHRDYRPWLLELVNRLTSETTVLHVTNVKDRNALSARLCRRD